ncbi:MAG: N-acetylmuramic acid 6-phosphate etherase [Lachnospiraceae bacterium]|nr:N-acetylmuramic acid 6-phosphate etherase [Lachnospiraceae bacterium]
MIDLSKLATEQRNPDTFNLDEMSPLEIATTMNSEDLNVVKAVKEVLPEVAKAIEMATSCLKKGGRIIYVGAGTSGRLGVLDAAECPPTFGVSDKMVVGLIAGGEKAFLKAIEGAEDSDTLCEKELKDLGLSDKDIVIGLAASGRTPYVIYGLRFARKLGAKTVAISCNKNSEISKEAEVAIEPVVGPEVLTGSTRLKSGTAQKMILNMISTGSMIGIGKVYKNLMVDVQQTNEKLIVRAQNICMEATGCTREEAKKALEGAKGSVKTAIVMILKNCDCESARESLEKSQGVVREALR